MAGVPMVCVSQVDYDGVVASGERVHIRDSEAGRRLQKFLSSGPGSLLIGRLALPRTNYKHIPSITKLGRDPYQGTANNL